MNTIMCLTSLGNYAINMCMSVNKVEKRVCVFCGCEWDASIYTPSVSCKKCRVKERNLRELYITTCQMCGTLFSTSSDAILCRSCASTLRHSHSEEYTCCRCGKRAIILKDGLCSLCRKDVNNLNKKRLCAYCGKELPKGRSAKVCHACRQELETTHKSGICLECGKKYSIAGESSLFCSDTCKSAWNGKHGKTDRRVKKSAEDIEASIISFLRDNPAATQADIVKASGVSAETLVRRGVVITDIKNKMGIPGRKKSSSVFEELIFSMLSNKGFCIEREKYFTDLKDLRYLRYDFFIPELNLLVEADGQQHYCSADASVRKLYKVDCIKAHDLAKNIYAKTNKYNLLRIHYFRESDKAKVTNFNTLLDTIQCSYRETGKMELFNCWNGSELLPIPISSQAAKAEGSETIPRGSRAKQPEMEAT